MLCFNYIPKTSGRGHYGFGPTMASAYHDCECDNSNTFNLNLVRYAVHIHDPQRMNEMNDFGDPVTFPQAQQSAKLSTYEHNKVSTNASKHLC